MPGVQRLQEIPRFWAAHLAENDPVRSVAETAPQQLAERDGENRRLLEAHVLRPARFELDDMRVRIRHEDFRRRFDQNHPLAKRNGFSERVEQRRLAGAAGNQHSLAVDDGRGETRGERLGETAECHQIGQAEAPPEFPNRQGGAFW